ncbi:MAG: hypothetical protein Kow0025_14070 [Thermodesulfovibrionales bacterium]
MAAAVFLAAMPFLGLPAPRGAAGADAPRLSRVFQSGLFPCSACHGAMEANPQSRRLSFHEDIALRGHGEPRRWCLDCHDAEDRDMLRLPSGERVGFAESFRLCGECHGNIYRDWRAGVHGKRTGSWDGAKEYSPCASCHDPHGPGFKPLRPEPPPLGPVQTLRR